MTIDELEGRALAQSVARACGMVQDLKHPRWWDCGPDCPDEGHGWCIDSDAPVYSGGVLLTYRPDINIAQAWELVEWITAKERRADFYLSREDDGRWSVVIHDLRWCHEDNYYKVTVDVYGESTAPVAICRAFLKAKAAR